MTERARQPQNSSIRLALSPYPSLASNTKFASWAPRNVDIVKVVDTLTSSMSASFIRLAVVCWVVLPDGSHVPLS